MRHWKISRILMVLPLMLLVSACTAISLSAQPTISATALRVGLLGDSSTDEYRGTDNRGGDYADVTFNWIELLVKYRDISAGAWGNWPEPRRLGYEYNWARSGATVSDVLARGQHTGLAEQISQGLIDIVIVNVGNNDFARSNGTYDAVYHGEIAGPALDAKVGKIVADYSTIVDTVLEAGDVPVIITTLLDHGVTPEVQTNPEFGDATRRQRVSDAVRQVNTGLIEMANARGISYFDSEAYTTTMLPEVLAGFDIGGRTFDFFSYGDEPSHGILGDGIHIGTLMEGFIANEYLTLINRYVEPDIPMLSHEELLSAVGF